MGSASFKVPHTEICYKKPCKFNLLLLFLKQTRSLNVTLKNINCQGERQTDNLYLSTMIIKAMQLMGSCINTDPRNKIYA